jgi:hypothetical protein
MEFLVILPFFTLLSFLSVCYANKLTIGIQIITTSFTFISFLISFTLFIANISDSNIIFVDMLS